jgi:hypothetical protein
MALDIAFWVQVLNTLVRLGDLLKRVWRSMSRGKRKVPATIVVVIPAGPWPLGWSSGPTIMGKPSMIVLGAFHFTNASDRPVSILGARLMAYYWKSRLLPSWKRERGVVVLPDQKGPISPGNTASGQAHWISGPAVSRPGAAIWGSVCFTDSYGNEHSTGLLTWPCRDGQPSTEGTR